MRSSRSRPGLPRRGVTLIEMLVAVALLVLMMTVIVAIFQTATGAVSAQRVYQELDGTLRQLDSTIRGDLLGVTARMTPPLNPRHGLGYFEYGENAFADSQGEDTDDYIRFTVKAPEGQFFTGRMYLAPMGITASGLGPVPYTTLTQDHQKAYLQSQPVTITRQYAEVIYFLRNHKLYRRVFLIAPERQRSVYLGTNGNGTSTVFSLNGMTASWQGVNDLSAHPSPTGTVFGPILNTLGDLTNRENRAFAPRYCNDYMTNGMGKTGPDNVADDENPINANGAPPFGDGILDYPRTLYPLLFSANPALTFEATAPLGRTPTYANMAFPYIYQWAYSQSDPSAGKGAGWIHSLDPTNTTGDPQAANATFNHAPLDDGDNLPVPNGAGRQQTWWGFPTWRETLRGPLPPPAPQVYWDDPVSSVSQKPGQPYGLVPFNPTTVPALTDSNLLPPLDGSLISNGYPAQLYNDGSGSSSFLSPKGVWEDDLIASGVRSFDVKAYDDSFPGYVDLGWGDDTRLSGGTQYYLIQTPAVTTWNGQRFDTIGQTFAHEGRIPPLRSDGRPDAQFPLINNNVGDDQAGVIRLRRIWDTWSTDYTEAPATGFNNTSGLPLGPPFSPPVFPSYPPPYPAPLRGIQIQIRVVDPRNERIKTLTIRHDFSDRL